jgi:hypothetical protein
MAAQGRLKFLAIAAKNLTKKTKPSISPRLPAIASIKKWSNAEQRRCCSGPYSRPRTGT